ncbi:FKBP-type peptidyl-prolyl cis-trans isomerase [uncultured Bacteroides sp.]|uniref:FKBP-type peptidyl-prolyl cis-trans isomerase n=1 Tax=uncultured Bacteroides sp. TaxID=162156 RepID=UPI00262A75A6|nr:FKBP-type peptidyl-prolyl cis-trans isomerase [uncultured Bacteroides sp.]
MENKYITVAYRLYAVVDGQKELLEEAPAAHPFQFISGIGYTLDRFEKEITILNKGDKFNFTIPCAEAYGERDEDNVRQVNKAMFNGPDGKFDSENIFPGNIIMLNDAEGHQFFANVGEITEDKVTLDLNHPHAGKDLIFEGEVTEMRPATNQEIQDIVNQMSGHGCGGNCGGCGGGCGEDGCGNHEHNDNDGCCGGGCGHCH